MRLSDDGLTLLGVDETDMHMDCLVVPEGVTHVAPGAFEALYFLKQVVLPNSLTHIGQGAFTHCFGLNVVNIPQNVVFIGEGAFLCCHLLKEVHFPPGLIFIGEGAFSACYKIKTLIIPGQVMHIGSRAFMSCYSLSELVIMQGVTHIQDFAFSDCVNLKRVILADTLQYIGFSALPHGVSHLGAFVVRDSSRIESIVIRTDDMNKYNHIVHLLPFGLKESVIPMPVYKAISAIQEKKMHAMAWKEIPHIFWKIFPVTFPKDLIALVYAYSSESQNKAKSALSKVSLPHDINVINYYEKALDGQVLAFNQEQRMTAQRELVIEKMNHYISLTEEIFQRQKLKNPNFFKQSRTKKQMKETEIKLEAIRKIISWLRGSFLIRLSPQEVSLLNTSFIGKLLTVHMMHPPVQNTASTNCCSIQ